MLLGITKLKTNWFRASVFRLTLGLSILSSSVTQAVSGTDISLFKILNSKEGISLTFKKTLVQRPGYDNQPAFTLDSKRILYTKMLGEQTDIWQVQLDDASSRAITKTVESEYSPTPLGSNTFSSVIAHEGKQTLGKYKDGVFHQLLSREVEPVGYHVWTSSNQLAMFRLAEPHELVLLDHDGDNAKGVVIAKNIGRSLAAQPSQSHLFYTQILEEGAWLTQYDLSKGVAAQLLALFPGQQDFAWHRDIGFIHSDGQSLYRSLRQAPNWVKLEVIGAPKLKQISRLAISPDGQWLAVVHADL